MKAVIIIIVLIGVLYYSFPLIQVIGDSMTPTYCDKEIIFGRRLYKKSKLKVGDVIVYRAPYDTDRIVIKRISRITKNSLGDRMFYCLGDNSECSHDSRNYGFVHSRNLVCKVINQRPKTFM